MTGDHLTTALFESAGVGIYGFDHEGTVVVINQAGADLLGWSPSMLAGRPAHATFHHSQADGSPAEADGCPIINVVRTGIEDRSDADTFWHRDGRPVPVWWVAAPTSDWIGAPTGESAADGVSRVAAVVVFGDASERQAQQITVASQLDSAERARRLAEADRDLARAGRDLAEAGRGVAEQGQELARRAVLSAHNATVAAETETARLLTLASLSELLNSLDVAGGLERIAELVVRELADGCIIDRVASKGELSRVCLARHDPTSIDDIALKNIGQLPRFGALDIGPLARVLRGQATDVVLNARAALDRPPLGDLDLAEDDSLARLDAAHVVVTRLFARGQLLGAMTWTRPADDVPFGEADVVMARLFGLRIGQWLENLRLNELQQDAALTLQRSLLTALPEPDQVELVARYLPAAEGTEVGGDWYDAVVAFDGNTVVAIGDVTGHDMVAATRMAQLRSVLRFTALRQSLDPAHTLAEVDEAMPALAISGQASVILATITADAAGRHELIWSNAGHLPPLLIGPDGTGQLLELRPEPILGLGPLRRERRADGSPRRTNHRTPLPAGATVVFYTDGLVERREEDLDTGLARLRAAAGQHYREPLGQFCESLLTQLQPGTGATDDVALIAVRLHPSPEAAQPD